MNQRLLDRFLRYVQIDTQSRPFTKKTPSTEKQFVLAELLAEELRSIGLENVQIDAHAYVTGHLPANIEKKVPTIGFIAHIDTSPDFTGKGVRPQIWKNYDGKDLLLNAEKNIFLSPNDFPELEAYIGQTLITTDGSTLLGADNKAGVAEIITAIERLKNQPNISHGPIKVAFTPDEETGHGAALLDIEKFGAEWAYTVDGGPIGDLEFENFNAAYAQVHFQGKSIHPGYAKDRMINASQLARIFANQLPEDETPEETDGLKGFFHLIGVEGDVEKACLEYLIRDHDRQKFESRKQLLRKITRWMNRKLGAELLIIEIEDQYYNMREKIEPVMHIVEIAKEAMKRLGVQPKIQAVRGGTDGAALSSKGLPCPNIFAGGHNFHGPYEFIPLESMEKAVEVIIQIAQITAEWDFPIHNPMGTPQKVQSADRNTSQGKPLP